MNYEDYIQPEVLVLVPVIYFIGLALKKTEKVSDKFIPSILGAAGIVLATLYVIASQGFSLAGLFTGITQGILVSGCSVYVNQLVKQSTK